VVLDAKSVIVAWDQVAATKRALSGDELQALR
jgi:hypothetical protein